MKASRKKITPFGTVIYSDSGNVTLKGAPDQMYDWANRPGARWPCSTLARLGSNAWALFDSRGDLVDLSPNMVDVDGAEFSAWSSDCLEFDGAPTP